MSFRVACLDWQRKFPRGPFILFTEASQDMKGVGAIGQFKEDMMGQLNGSASFSHLKPYENSVVDQILGINPGLKQEPGAQFCFVLRRTVMIKHQVLIDIYRIITFAHDLSLTAEFGLDGRPLIVEKMQQANVFLEGDLQNLSVVVIVTNKHCIALSQLQKYSVLVRV